MPATPPEAPHAARARLVILTGLDVRAFRGGEKYAATLGRELARRGVRVLLYSKVDPNERHRLDPNAFPSELGVPVRFYRLLWLPLVPPVLRDPLAFLRTLRGHDTIFTLEATPRFAALVVVLARLLGRRSVVGFHHPTQADDLARELSGGGVAAVRARLFRWFLRRASALHTINESHAAALRHAGLTNVWMVHSFTTAVPLPPEPATDGTTFRALFVGPLEREQKGIDLLVDVARRVLAERPDVELAIAGAGRDAALVHALAADHPGRVEILGFVPEERLPTVYARADALWLTSRAESFSLVALEGFTQGVPVVSFAVAGLRDVTEIFPDGRVPPFDTAAFAAKAIELVDRRASAPEAWRALRQRLRTDAVARLGAAAMVPKLAEMLAVAIRPPSDLVVENRPGGAPPGPPPASVAGAAATPNGAR